MIIGGVQPFQLLNTEEELNLWQQVFSEMKKVGIQCT